MSENKYRVSSDGGGQVKDDDNVASYKLVSDTDGETRSSKSNLRKSKEKVSDEAEEKLLDKEAEAKIVTRVDMADAKYVVGDHRNGDAKIELDANKRQFSGLTKEELLKYADDPFWVRLRWSMFVLFWLLWLCMLAGAIAIIVRAPKCALPKPKTWYEKGPLIDTTSLDTYESIEDELKALKAADVQGIFTDVTPAYEIFDSDIQERIKKFVATAKEHGIKVIADLIPNFVPTTHSWFELSANRTPPYESYFTWAKGGDYLDGVVPQPPNNWVSTLNAPAWTWNDDRKEFYLHQYGADQPDLNFHNPAVVAEFDKVLRMWMKTGVAGVRLHKVRQILVNSSLPNEVPEAGGGVDASAVHTAYRYWRHTHTSDHAGLDSLLARWSQLVADSAPDTETVFTIAEERKPELFLLHRNVSTLRPAAAAPLRAGDLTALLHDLDTRLPYWPALQLDVEGVEFPELAAFALLLPAAPVLPLSPAVDNSTEAENKHLSHLVSLRSDSSVEHGSYNVGVISALDSDQQLLAIARWKAGHTGYAAVLNAGQTAVQARVALAPLPAALALHHLSPIARALTNYTVNQQVSRDELLVPAKSTIVLSFVPAAADDQ